MHLHGNDYFYFEARRSQRPSICTKEQQCVDAWAPNEVTDSVSNQFARFFLFAVSKSGSWPHKPECIGWSLCHDPHRSATLYYRFVKHKHILWACVCVNTVSIYLFSFYVTAVSNMIEVSWEERVYYLLQLSALFAVLCRSSTGLPLNAIRLRLWLFAFLIIAGMLFEACDKHSTTPPLLLGCMHTQQRQCAPTNAHANVRDAHKPSLGSCLSHNMC